MKDDATSLEDPEDAPDRTAEAKRAEIAAIRNMLLFAARGARRVGGHDAAALVDEAVSKLDSDLARSRLN
ncbi:MAG: hypothetical protein AAGF90_09085 [Pseudomonadota bacterium]